jgi:nucleoid DNA-binding protein
MNKTEVVKTLSKELGITQTETEQMYDSLVKVMTNNLANDTGFSLPGLGTFGTKVRDAYKSYNPHYDQMMMMPKKKVVTFTSSTSLKDELKEGGL